MNQVDLQLATIGRQVVPARKQRSRLMEPNRARDKRVHSILAGAGDQPPYGLLEHQVRDQTLADCVQFEYLSQCNDGVLAWNQHGRLSILGQDDLRVLIARGVSRWRLTPSLVSDKPQQVCASYLPGTCTGQMARKTCELPKRQRDRHTLQCQN